MNWEQVEGDWKSFKGKVREQWNKLTDDDVGVVAGQKDQLVGAIQKRYGVAKEEAHTQLNSWLTSLKEKIDTGTEETKDDLAAKKRMQNEGPSPR